MTCIKCGHDRDPEDFRKDPKCGANGGRRRTCLYCSGQRSGEKTGVHDMRQILGDAYVEDVTEHAVEEPEEEPPPKLVLPPGSKPPEIPPDNFVDADHPMPVRLICDGDLHYPINDPYVTAAKMAFARDFQPDTWINVGDMYDFWGISRHEKEAERLLELGGRLQEEFDSARDYWSEVTRISKNVHFIPGNHERRLSALVNANQALFGLRAFEWGTLAGIPASVRIHKYGTQLDIAGINFEHGDRITGGMGAIHLAYLALAKRVTNVIFGHTHRIDTRYRTFRRDGQVKTIVSHNQGHGSDVSKQTYAGPCPDWQHGFTAIEWYSVGGQPRFTIHAIPVVGGRFMFGGKLYDGHRCQ